MENIHFKGLDKALKDGCFIKVFSCSLKYPVVRVEKINEENKKSELVSYAENAKVVSALNSASNKIINELKENDHDNSLYERTLIDSVVEQGYTLHFYKLSNGQVLSAICINGYDNYIPIKSVITDDIVTGFKTLNEILEDFNQKFKFFDFVESQATPVYDYQKKLTLEKRK